MRIGEKIRELRKARGITQEQLAGNIGISFQAISKWENGIALPDITLTPVLASYFGVSMDELFDFNLQKIEAEVKKITDEAYKFRINDPQKSRSILEEGLRIYPQNDILLNNLLYVLDYDSNPDETIEVASKLIEKTAQSEVKYDALRFLAYAYKAKGDIKSAETAIEQIPEIYFTKLTETAFVAEGKTKFDAAGTQKAVSFQNLLDMMWKLSECYESNGEIQKAIAEAQTALNLITAMGGTSFNGYADFFKKELSRLTSKL
ncbi:MAG: helix-turn-helix transcriptional regulator [Clostridia bacterium]|nr:helix-turn-helix transcriptional regulator [Clostridia bacterium]